MSMLTGQQGPLQHVGVLMTKLTQVRSLPGSHKESILPPTKLAHPDTGQLGPLGRVPNRPQPHTIPKIITRSHSTVKGKSCYGVTGGTGTPDKRGYSGDHTISSWFFLPDLSVREERGRVLPCNQPQMLESIRQGEHFKMEGLHVFRELIQQGDWVMKLDLKNAYLQISIHPNHQPLLQFIWKEKHYGFQCLPFVLSAARQVFTKLLKSVVGFLRQIGLRIIIYLDNMLFMHVSKEQLAAMAPIICRLFEVLGLIVNMKKSLLTPTQIIEFLGFQISSCALTVSLPSEKSRKIHLEVRTVEHSSNTKPYQQGTWQCS